MGTLGIGGDYRGLSCLKDIGGSVLVKCARYDTAPVVANKRLSRRE